jgi:hypothetical protein
MSKGLGQLQREILAAIDKYRNDPQLCWRGGEVVPSGAVYAVAAGVEFQLPDGVFDIRGIARFVGKKLNRSDAAFQASYSRAVRQLVHRGLLVAVPSMARGRFYKRYADALNTYEGDAA